MTPLSPFLVKLYLVVTVLLGGGPWPDDLPKAYSVSQAKMTTINPVVEGDGVIVAAYLAGSNRIYIYEKVRPFDNVQGASYLIHELQHHVQYYQDRRLDHTCAENQQLEREAYAVQDRFLALFGETGVFKESYIAPCKE